MHSIKYQNVLFDFNEPILFKPTTTDIIILNDII